MSEKVCIVDLTDEYSNKLPKYVMEAACEYAKKQISFAPDFSLEVVIGTYETGVFAKKPNVFELGKRVVIQSCILDFIAGWKCAQVNVAK